MASEIRVNSISNRSGLGTITFGSYGVEIAGITTIEQLKVSTGTEANFTGVVTATSFVGAGVNVTGVVTATSYQGDGSALTGIDATSLKDSGDNVKVQAEASGIVITGVATASSSIEVGETFIKAHSIGIGTTTTAGRNAGVGTAAGTLAYSSDDGTFDIYNGETWINIKSVNKVVEYLVYTSPGTADLTANNSFAPDARVDVIHLTPGGSGGSGSPGNGGSDSGGGSGGGGTSGTLVYKLNNTIATLGSSVPITLPSAPSPLFPGGSSPGGGAYGGGPSTPGSGGAYAGPAGTNASYTISPWSPFFSDYTFSNGNGGSGGQQGGSSFAGNGGGGGGGGLVITRNSSLPTSLAPAVPTPGNGTDGSQAAGLCEYSSNGARGGGGGTGFSGGGGGGGGGSECGGGTTPGAAGGAGCPGIVIIRVEGYLA